MDRRLPKSMAVVKSSMDSELPREVTFAYLNKSVLIKGKELGVIAFAIGSFYVNPPENNSNPQ